MRERHELYDFLLKHFMEHWNMEKNKKCACCGKNILPPDSLFEICLICGWQQDEAQEDDPNYCGGANELSLNEYKKKHLQKQSKQNGWLKELDRIKHKDGRTGTVMLIVGDGKGAVVEFSGTATSSELEDIETADIIEILKTVR